LARHRGDYLLSDVGSVAAGWLSSSMIKRGSTVNAARKIVMLICAIGVTPVVFAYRVESTWSAVFLIGLAAACHQGFSANLFTLTSDMFPARAVGSVVGIGGMAGAIGVCSSRPSWATCFNGPGVTGCLS